MKRITFEIVLTVQGPLLTKSSDPGGWGLDMVMARDGSRNPVLHGSHVGGKMREALRSVGLDPDVLLGRPNDAGGYEPLRKRLFLSDFTLLDACGAGVRHRIAIDEDRGAARETAICFAEDLFAAGGRYRFSGRGECHVKDNQEGREIEKLVNTGLRAIGQLGSQRSVGYGRLLAVDITSRVDDLSAPSQQWEFKDGLELAITPLDPFCVSERRVRGNLFESTDILAGGVIAGSVANLWRRMLGKEDLGTAIDRNFDTVRPELGEHFDQLRFSHALPGALCLQRPVRWPMSLVRADKRVLDVAGLDGPHLINGMAPAFEVDWKGNGDVRALFGWRDLPRELRVRTSIDPGKRRAVDAELFAQELVVPDGNCWYARVTLPDDIPANERKKAMSQLASLLVPGLFGIGKTKARAKVTLLPPGTLMDRVQSDLSPREERWIVTLQSPALLTAPESLDETSGSAELFAAYQAAWRDISKNTLELERFFARQGLAGGEYFHHRFQGGGKSYRPWLLTEAGSVFVLRAAKGKEESAQEKIARWQHLHLDLPSCYSKTDWRQCPYLPQLGFGEIAVNLSIHFDPMFVPAAGELTRVTVLQEKQGGAA